MGNNAWTNLIGVFWNPGTVMKQQAEKPRIGPPYLLLMLVAALVVGFAGDMAYNPAPMPDEMMWRPPGELGPADPMAAAFLMQLGLGVAIALALPWVYGLLQALVMWLVGGRGSYKPYLAVAGYAMVPALVGLVLKLLLSSAAGAPGDLSQVQYSLAFFLPEATGFMRQLYLNIDIFHLWTLVLLVIGFAAVKNGKKSPWQFAWVAPLIFFLNFVLNWIVSVIPVL